jgi:hypothetical protein
VLVVPECGDLLFDDRRVFAAVERPVRERPVLFALRMMRADLAMGSDIGRLGGLRRGLRERGKVQRTQSVGRRAGRDLDHIMRRVVFVIVEAGQTKDAGGVPDARIGSEPPRESAHDGLGVVRRKILNLPEHLVLAGAAFEYAVRFRHVAVEQECVERGGTALVDVEIEMPNGRDIRFGPTPGIGLEGVDGEIYVGAMGVRGAKMRLITRARKKFRRAEFVFDSAVLRLIRRIARRSPGS